MALTWTLDKQPDRMGEVKVSHGSVAMDNSCPSAGESITPNVLGFDSGIYAIEFTGLLKGANLHFEYGSQKVIARLPGFGRHCLNPAQAARNLVTAAADVTIFQHGKDLYVVGFSSVVTVLLAMETIQPVMSIEKRDADGAANAVELATITYGATDAVGTVDCVMVGTGDVGGAVDVASALASPYKVPAGYTLVLKHKTAGTGAAAAGQAKCHLWVVSCDAGEPMPDAFDLSGITAARFTAYGW